MSKTSGTRDQKRADQYRRFQGFVYQELETARRWKTYCPCDYGWLCELDDHQHFYTVLKYLIKKNNIDIYTLSSSSVPNVLRSINYDQFMICLQRISSTGSLEDLPSDTEVSNPDEENIENVSQSGTDINLDTQSVDARNEETAALHQDVGIEENLSHIRSESEVTFMMNQYSNESMPVVVIASSDLKDKILQRSVQPIRDFDSKSSYSPVTISDNCYLLRCGKKKFLVKDNYGKTKNIKNSEYLKCQNVETLVMKQDSRLYDKKDSCENTLESWMQGHQFEVNATNDLCAVTMYDGHLTTSSEDHTKKRITRRKSNGQPAGKVIPRKRTRLKVNRPSESSGKKKDRKTANLMLT